MHPLQCKPGLSNWVGLKLPTHIIQLLCVKAPLLSLIPLSTLLSYKLCHDGTDNWTLSMCLIVQLSVLLWQGLQDNNLLLVTSFTRGHGQVNIKAHTASDHKQINIQLGHDMLKPKDVTQVSGGQTNKAHPWCE